MPLLLVLTGIPLLLLLIGISLQLVLTYNQLRRRRRNNHVRRAEGGEIFSAAKSMVLRGSPTVDTTPAPTRCNSECSLESIPVAGRLVCLLEGLISYKDYIVSIIGRSFEKQFIKNLQFNSG